MPLLLDDDYDELNQRGIEYAEDEARRLFVFRDYRLPGKLYRQALCDLLVVIPPNYNQEGNDMFWTNPRLERADGRPIPQSNDPGGGDSRSFEGREFCRWSRHWRCGPSVWRPGQDNVVTILRRIECALANPDAQ